MTPKEHAEIWRRAARVVAALDPRRSWRQQAYSDPQFQGGWVGRSYSQEESAAWESYSVAAATLNAIAAEYEKDSTWPLT